MARFVKNKTGMSRNTLVRCLAVGIPQGVRVRDKDLPLLKNLTFIPASVYSRTFSECDNDG